MKRGLAAAAVIGFIVLVWTVWDQEAVMSWIGGAGPLPFFAAMAILPALGAPITPFFVVAGATFGITVGIVGSLLALALHLTLCYFVARSRLRPRVAALLRRFDHEIPDFEQAGKSAVRFVLLVKLAPGIPGFVKHYGLGAARVPFALYLVTSMLITGTYGALLVVLGESLLEHDRRTILAVAGVVAALVLGVWWLRRRQAPEKLAAAPASA